MNSRASIVRIKEGDEWKAAFRTNRGLYEPTVMFFGLCNSPSTFQRMMNDILRELIDEGHVIVYLDDILIFSDSIDEHRRLTFRVLSKLQEHKLCLKPEKCFFDQKEVQYLGLIVGNGQLRTDPEKISAVAGWKVPQNKKALQSFLGFVNFYRRFVKDFSKIAKPLHSLTGKVPWCWGNSKRRHLTTSRRCSAQNPSCAFPLTMHLSVWRWIALSTRWEECCLRRSTTSGTRSHIDRKH